MSKKRLRKNIKYRDYEKWNDSEEWEIINGKAYSMISSKNTKHQEIGLKILTEIGNFLKNKSNEIFYNFIQHI